MAETRNLVRWLMNVVPQGRLGTVVGVASGQIVTVRTEVMMTVTSYGAGTVRVVRRFRLKPLNRGTSLAKTRHVVVRLMMSRMFPMIYLCYVGPGAALGTVATTFVPILFRSVSVGPR